MSGADSFASSERRGGRPNNLPVEMRREIFEAWWIAGLSLKQLQEAFYLPRAQVVRAIFQHRAAMLRPSERLPGLTRSQVAYVLEHVLKHVK